MRERWVVQMSAAEVKEAAIQKMKHHLGLVEFWQGELEETEEKLRREGIVFRSDRVTGGYRTTPTADPQMLARMEECRNKLTGHEYEARRFSAYARLLGCMAEENQTVPLDVDDFDHFCIGVEAMEDEE